MSLVNTLSFRSLRTLRPVQCSAYQRPVAYVEGEGPGTGHRHAPVPVERSRSPGPADKFECVSSKEMYERFPQWVHSSVPTTAVPDPEPAGVAACRAGDGGPNTGRRRPPPPSMPRTASPRLPYPSSGPAADLKRDLLAKQRILLSD